MKFNQLPSRNFSVHSNLKHLFMQKYERYLPTAFDSSHSLLEKVNKIIESHNKIIDIINDHREYTNDQLFKAFGIIDENLRKQLESFQEEMDEQKQKYEEIRDKINSDLLPESVETKLEEWLLDGTIEEMILDTIFVDLMDKIEAVENRAYSLSLSVDDFGASGDGVYNNNDVFDEAVQYLSENGGGELRIPDGVYNLTRSITVPSNVSIIGTGNKSTIKTNGQIYVFATYGSFSTDQKSLNSNAGLGDTRLQVANTQGLKVGDDIHLISQRVATSEDAGKRSRLGMSTAERHNVRFAESFKISGLGSNYVDINEGLVFSGYRTNRSQESDNKAGSSAFIRKANYTKNVKIANLNIVGETSTAINITKSRDCVVENVNWEGQGQGTLVRFVDSVNCKAVNCSHILGENDFSQSSRISFLSVSSVLCGFEGCYVENTRTPFDITYNTVEDIIMPSMWCYVTNCKTKGTYRGITTHGGTYGSKITNNEFIGCEHIGIQTRSREAVITGNTVTGHFNQSVQQVGISLYQGSAQDFLVANNHVRGFSNGVQLVDGSSLPFEHVGGIITDNIIINVNIGVSLRRAYSHAVNVPANLVISGNKISKFYGSYAKGINIASHYRDVHIKNNVLIGNSSTNAGIYTGDGVYDLTLTGNVLKRFSGPTLWFVGVNDTATHGTSQKTNLITSDNMFDPEMNENRTESERLSVRTTRLYSSLRPLIDDRSWLGTSNYRYRILYSVLNPVISSDKNDKENIKDEELGLSFLNKLKPVTYTRKDESNDEFSGKTEHGLIAQDVEEVLKSFGAENHSLVHKDKENDKYSLSLQELIPIIIRSIQELQDKK